MIINGTSRGINDLIPILVGIIFAISILSLISGSFAATTPDMGIASPTKGNLTSQSDMVSKTATNNPTSSYTSRSSLLSSSMDSNLSFTTGGNAPWQVDNHNYHRGLSSARSGKIPNKSESWIRTTITGPGTLKWWWKVSSESGYDYLKLYLDGTQIGGITGAVGWKQKVLNFKSGTHTITWIYKKDEFESEGSDTAWLDDVKWTPGVNTKLNLNTYAILVGVGEYKKLGTLSFPDDDVFDMYDLCSRLWNMPTSNIYSSINSNATKKNIQNLIKTVSSRIKTYDKLLFFFSGHGSVDMDTNPLDEKDGLDEYIDVYEVDGQSNKISDDELHNWFNNFPTNNILFIFDSCYSGGLAENKITKSSNTQNYDLNKYNVLMACSEDQLSYEYTELNNGLFTYYLCEAFEGANNPKIDLNLNGVVSGLEAFKYAKIKTWDYSKEQNPQLHDANLSQEFEIIDRIAPSISINKRGSSYNSGQKIVLTMNEPGKIYYIIKNTQMGQSTLYTGPIIIKNTSTLYYCGKDLAGNKSPLYVQSYIMDFKAPKISQATPHPGHTNVAANQIIRISFNENIKPGKNFKNITLKTVSGVSVTTKKVIRGNMLIMSHPNLFRGTKYVIHIPHYSIRDIAGNYYGAYATSFVVDSVKPIVIVSNIRKVIGNYRVVQLAINEPGTIYFTTDGTKPNLNSYKYVGALQVSKTMVVKYFAMDLATNQSPYYVLTYFFNSKISKP